MSDPTPSSQCIYILGDDAVFEESLTNMLNAHTGKRAIRQTFVDKLKFFSDIDTYRPAVFLLNASSSSIVVNDILSLLRDSPSSCRTHVLVIRYDSNFVDLFEPSPTLTEYTHSQKSILNWSDFSSIVEEHCLTVSF